MPGQEVTEVEDVVSLIGCFAYRDQKLEGVLPQLQHIWMHATLTL